jgi:hypothetical protein
MGVRIKQNVQQITPLEIPGEINLTASQVLLELPTQEKQARQKTFWQPYGWIFTDPNGAAPMDATPFRAHKIFILSDALSWISLIGSKTRNCANSRSTNFWAWFSQGLEKLGDMGSAMAPREAYGVESEKNYTKAEDIKETKNINRNDSITINVALKFHEKDSVLLREKRIHKNTRQGSYTSKPFIQKSDHDFTIK